MLLLVRTVYHSNRVRLEHRVFSPTDWSVSGTFFWLLGEVGVLRSLDLFLLLQKYQMSCLLTLSLWFIPWSQHWMVPRSTVARSLLLVCYNLLGTRGKSKIKLVPKAPVCVVQNEPGDTSKEVHSHRPLPEPRYTLTTGPWSGTVGVFS